MADHQHREPCRGAGTQMGGEEGDRLHVEMVGGLVQHDQVVVAQQHLNQPDPPPFATGQGFDGAVQVHTGQQCLDDLPPIRPGRIDVIGGAVQDHLPDRFTGGAGLMLGQHPDGSGVRDRHSPGIGDQIARQDAQQGGLPIPVAADHADHLTRPDPEAHPVQQHTSAEGVRDGFQIDQICHVRKATSENRGIASTGVLGRGHPAVVRVPATKASVRGTSVRGNRALHRRPANQHPSGRVNARGSPAGLLSCRPFRWAWGPSAWAASDASRRAPGAGPPPR